MTSYGLTGNCKWPYTADPVELPALSADGACALCLAPACGLMAFREATGGVAAFLLTAGALACLAGCGGGAAVTFAFAAFGDTAVVFLVAGTGLGAWALVPAA